MQSGRWITWLWGAALLVSAMLVHAEGGCPEGQYSSSGQGWQACIPIPGSDDTTQQATGVPQAFQGADHWVDKWGAIATHGPDASLGTVDGMLSQDAAEHAALAKCHAQHGSTCKIMSYYRNGCGVMVIDDTGKYYNANGGATLGEATHKALKTCTDDGHQNCHVYYSGCSFPQRLQ